MNIYILISKLNRVLIFVLFGLFLGCKIQKIQLKSHNDGQNCMFKSYLAKELNENDTNYDKALLLRTNFCGSELCSSELYKSMIHFVNNENKRVLIIVNFNDTVITKMPSIHSQIKIRVDSKEKYLKYGFQRPGHYAFLFNKSSCPTQYINITESFIKWFEKQ